MKLHIHTILFVYLATTMPYTAASAIPPELDLDIPADSSLNQGMIDALAANGARAHAATCRWTNCNENCPAGFVEIPRDHGAKGEMIWEHTQCGGNGLTKFCCPPHPDMTKCYWRGFSNSGKCTPGCDIGKVGRGAEVGTTTAGCSKSGYQSVCCTTPASEEARAGVFAYYQCGWYSARKFPKKEKKELCAEPGKSFTCPAERPHMITSSNLGFGGEVECLEGLRSYCCAKDMLPIFKTCQWQPSCPNDQIRVAVRSDGGDSRAFCCAGETLQPKQPPAKPEPKPTPIAKPDPKPEPDDDWVARVNLFKGEVDYWMDRRYGELACPQEMQPPVIDWMINESDSKAASGLEVATEHEAASVAMSSVDFAPNSACVRSWTAISDFLKVLTNITIDKYVGDERQSMYRVLDRKLASLPDCSNCNLADFLRFSDQHEEFNKTALIYDFLENPRISRGGIQCIPGPDHFAPASGLEANGDDAAAALQRRVIENDLDPRNGLLEERSYPVTFGRVMEAIDNGALTLHYAQWLYSNEQLRPGPYLELAYWIGQVPGQVPNAAEDSNLRLDELRDRRTSLNNPDAIDRWVILHLHLDSSAAMRRFMFSEERTAVDADPRTETLRTFTNIAAISFYHAQTWIPLSDLQGNEFMWVIDWTDQAGRGGHNRGGRNTRRVLNCRYDSPNDRNGPPQVYPLIPVGPGPVIGERRIVDPAWAPGTAPYRVFTNLYNQGYLSYPGMQPIFNEPQGISRSNEYNIYDISPASINGGFRMNAGHWPLDASRMLGTVGYDQWERARIASPWHSPFLIERTGGSFQIRPVTQQPNFRSAMSPRPPPPPPGPSPPPPIGPPPSPPPMSPLSPTIGPQASAQQLLSVTHLLEGPQSSLPPQPSKTPGGGNRFWIWPVPEKPMSGGDTDSEPMKQGLNSTVFNVTILPFTS